MTDNSELDWEPLNPGIYDAEVVAVNYSFKDTISINVVYEVTKADGSAYVLSEWLALEAPKTSPRYVQTAEGKGRLAQLLQLKGLSISDVKSAGGLEAIPGMVIGIRPRVVVGNQERNGLMAPVIRGIMGVVTSQKDKRRGEGG